MCDLSNASPARGKEGREGCVTCQTPRLWEGERGGREVRGGWRGDELGQRAVRKVMVDHTLLNSLLLMGRCTRCTPCFERTVKSLLLFLSLLSPFPIRSTLRRTGTSYTLLPPLHLTGRPARLCSPVVSLLARAALVVCVLAQSEIGRPEEKRGLRGVWT